MGKLENENGVFVVYVAICKSNFDFVIIDDIIITQLVMIKYVKL